MRLRIVAFAVAVLVALSNHNTLAQDFTPEEIENCSIKKISWYMQHQYNDSSLLIYCVQNDWFLKEATKGGMKSNKKKRDTYKQGKEYKALIEKYKNKKSPSQRIEYKQKKKLLKDKIEKEYTRREKEILQNEQQIQAALLDDLKNSKWAKVKILSTAAEPVLMKKPLNWYFDEDRFHLLEKVIGEEAYKQLEIIWGKYSV